MPIPVKLVFLEMLVYGVPAFQIFAQIKQAYCIYWQFLWFYVNIPIANTDKWHLLLLTGGHADIGNNKAIWRCIWISAICGFTDNIGKSAAHDISISPSHINFVYILSFKNHLHEVARTLPLKGQYHLVTSWFKKIEREKLYYPWKLRLDLIISIEK